MDIVTLLLDCWELIARELKRWVLWRHHWRGRAMAERVARSHQTTVSTPLVYRDQIMRATEDIVPPLMGNNDPQSDRIIR